MEYICDKCTKKDVCSLKEAVMRLEMELRGKHIDDAITLTAHCRHRNTADTLQFATGVRGSDFRDRVEQKR